MINMAPKPTNEACHRARTKHHSPLTTHTQRQYLYNTLLIEAIYFY